MRAIYFDKSVPRVLSTLALKRMWKGAIFGPTAPVRFTEMEPPPVPGTEGIRLRNKLCGICASDLHLLYVDVQHEDGTVTAWVIEGGAAHGIVSAGLTKDSLALGPTVIVRGYQSRDKQCMPHCKANGRDFVFE